MDNIYDWLGFTVKKDDIVFYLKNRRTGSSTIRKCKNIGKVIEQKKDKIKVQCLKSETTQDVNKTEYVYLYDVVNINSICCNDSIKLK